MCEATRAEDYIQGVPFAVASLANLFDRGSYNRELAERVSRSVRADIEKALAMLKEREDHKQAARAALARIDELEQVLRPFAMTEERPDIPDARPVTGLGFWFGSDGKLPTVGDCRAARAALEAKP